MSKRTVTFKVCDGCHHNDYNDGIEIVHSLNRYHTAEFGDDTLDLCGACDERGRYLCRICRTVHEEDQQCPGRTV
jgi:hypothetical protein